MEENQSLLPSDKTSEEATYQGITYNKAIAKTVYLNPKSPPLSTSRRMYVKACCGCNYQLWLVFWFIVVGNLIDVYIYGLGILTKNPRHFDCLDEASGEWHQCKKQKICDE
jgi:hypothetical protein